MSNIISFHTWDEARQALEADEICKRVGKILVQHYPRRRWHVQVSAKGGVIQIGLPQVSTEFAWVLHLDRHRDYKVLQEAVVRAGGTMLEMFNLKRERSSEGGEQSLLRDGRGNALHAKTGL